jgi:hypothetical protein
MIVHIVPVTDILLWSSLVPYDKHWTIPHDWHPLARYYPQGVCDCQGSPGRGPTFYYINSWAMIWSSDNPCDPS